MKHPPFWGEELQRQRNQDKEKRARSRCGLVITCQKESLTNKDKQLPQRQWTGISGSEDVTDNRFASPSFLLKIWGQWVALDQPPAWPSLHTEPVCLKDQNGPPCNKPSSALHTGLAQGSTGVYLLGWASPGKAAADKEGTAEGGSREARTWMGEGMFYNQLVGGCLRRQTNPIGPLPQASFNLYLAFPFSVIEYIIYFGQQLPHVAFRTTTISF